MKHGAARCAPPAACTFVFSCCLAAVLVAAVTVVAGPLPRTTGSQGPRLIPGYSPHPSSLNARPQRPVVSVGERGTTLAEFATAHRSVMLLVTDDAARGRGNVFYPPLFLRGVRRLDEEGFTALDVGVGHLAIPQAPADFEKLRAVVSAMGRAAPLNPPCIVMFIDARVANQTVVAADGTPVQVVSEAYWMDGVPAAVAANHRGPRVPPARSLALTGTDVFASRVVMTIPLDEHVSEEVAPALHRLTGPAMKTVSSEQQLRFRIFEAYHADKVGFVLWEPPAATVARGAFSEHALQRFSITRDAFTAVAARHRLRFTFSIVSPQLPPEDRAALQLRYNPYRYDIVAYALDRDMWDSLGMRPVGFNLTHWLRGPSRADTSGGGLGGAGAREGRLALAVAAMTNWTLTLLRERHIPRISALELDAEEVRRTGQYNLTRGWRAQTLREPPGACAERRVVSGDTIQAVVRGNSASTGAEFLLWPYPGFVFTVGAPTTGLPQLLHRLFLGMCVGMRRQVIVPPPPPTMRQVDKREQELLSLLLLDDSDQFSVEVTAILNAPTLTPAEQERHDPSHDIARWRRAEIEEWRALERVIKDRAEHSKYIAH